MGWATFAACRKAFERVGHEAVVTRETLRSLIAPVTWCCRAWGPLAIVWPNVTRYGLVDPIHRAIQVGKPFLGICVGFQLLFAESEEFGCHKGLGLLPGKVKAIPLPKNRASVL